MHPFVHFLGLTLPAFGLMMCCGMLSALGLLFFTRRYSNFSEDDVLTATLYAIICGIVGAKLLYWITELKSIIANPAVFQNMILSGFVFYGSLIGGLLGVLWFCKRNKKGFFAVADLFLPALTLGQAFGRIGCFLAGCCYGQPATGWLSVTFPAGCAAPAGVPLVPTQLLESAFLFILTVILVWILSLKKTPGTVSGWYAVLYGVWRFIIEFYRADERGAVGALSTSQFIGVFVILVGITLLVLIKKGMIVSRETAAEESAKDVQKEDQNKNSKPYDEKPAAETENPEEISTEGSDEFNSGDASGSDSEES